MATKTRKPRKKKTAKPAAEAAIDSDDFMVPMRWRARMYCAETDTGCVILTGEQARALASAVNVALSFARPKAGSGTEENLIAAIETLDHTFGLGIGCDCDE